MKHLERLWQCDGMRGFQCVLILAIAKTLMMGKPVIKGTRNTVELILESLSAGESVDNLLASYPRLTKEAIFAAFAFAAEALKGEKTYPVAV